MSEELEVRIEKLELRVAKLIFSVVETNTLLARMTMDLSSDRRDEFGKRLDELINLNKKMVEFAQEVGRIGE